MEKTHTDGWFGNNSAWNSSTLDVIDLDEASEESVVEATRVAVCGNGGGSPHNVNDAQGLGGMAGVHFLRDFRRRRGTHVLSFRSTHKLLHSHKLKQAATNHTQRKFLINKLFFFSGFDQ